jgi:hypothetical protein
LNRIDRILELALGLAFVAAGVLKVLDPADFALAVSRLRVVPEGMIGGVAILLPWVEIVAGTALLLTRRYRDAATVMMLGLLGIFTLILVFQRAAGASGSCGCFGTRIAFLNRPDVGLARNLILMAAAATLVVRRRKATSRAGPASPA